MDNYLLIVGRAHGSKAPVVISGPEVPMVEQRKKFLDMRCLEKHPEYEYAELIGREVLFSKRFGVEVKAESQPKKKNRNEAV